MSARVLVVDDEEIVVKSCLRILEGGGYDLEGTHSGAEALRKIEERHYDVIILDIMMPEISGLDARA